MGHIVGPLTSLKIVLGWQWSLIFKCSFCCLCALGCVAFTGALSTEPGTHPWSKLTVPFLAAINCNSSLARGKTSYRSPFSMLPFCLACTFTGLVHAVVATGNSSVQQVIPCSSQLWSKSNGKSFLWIPQGILFILSALWFFSLV